MAAIEINNDIIKKIDTGKTSSVGILILTEKLLDSFPSDQKTIDAKIAIDRLRRRISILAPELHTAYFWKSDMKYTGYYDICRKFDSDNDRSMAMKELYASVLQAQNMK